MKNKAFYNTIKSSLIMDQVFTKYAIYEKTYFGSLGGKYDFTKGIEAYENAPVWSSGLPEGLYKRNDEPTYSFNDGLRFDCKGKTRRMGLSVVKDCKEITIKFKIDAYVASAQNWLLAIYPWDMENKSNIDLQYVLVGDNLVSLQVINKKDSTITYLENYEIGVDNTLTLNIIKRDNSTYIVNGVKINISDPVYTENNNWLGFNISSANKTDITSMRYTVQKINCN